MKDPVSLHTGERGLFRRGPRRVVVFTDLNVSSTRLSFHRIIIPTIYESGGRSRTITHLSTPLPFPSDIGGDTHAYTANGNGYLPVQRH